MKQSKFYLLIGILLLSISCNKGNFNPTICGDCPELMTCYEGICDCDTMLADKFWDLCFDKHPSRFVYRNSDSIYGMTLMILDSVSHNPSRGDYRYQMYSDEKNPAPLPPHDFKQHPILYSTQIVTKTNFDSIYLKDFYPYNINGNQIRRGFEGKKYGTDSMELRFIQINLDNNELNDTSLVLTFLKR